MSKVFIEETTLSAIGDAIRGKTGKTELIAPLSMATEISSITTGGGGGDIDIEPIVLTGNCNYIGSGALASAYIKMFGDTISTDNINNLSSMFRGFTGEVIPFDLNCASSGMSASYTFDGAENLKALPKINNLKTTSLGSFFNNCYDLRTIPEDFASNWDWSSFHTNYYGDYTKFFQNCYSLRSIPQELLNNLWSGGTTSSYVMNSMFQKCYALDEINGLYVNEEVEWKSNVFSYAFHFCSRITNLKFTVNEDGTPKIAKWKNQTIDLTNKVGYLMYERDIMSYNSGIPHEKLVYKDYDNYHALKNDADWYAVEREYSRYNRISAVNTINSLPDTSAYLAANGGTNTIKFEGKSGSKTDGGAIDTMTEEEIAVATVKGWTISFT